MTNEKKQCILKYLGYYEGKVDGAWGPLSKAATTDFQVAEGIQADGIFGNGTLEQALDAVYNSRFKVAAPDNAPDADTPSENTPETSLDDTGTFWDDIPYFVRDEFACTCRGKYCNGFPVEPDEKMVRVVNAIREHFGRPFSPNSAIRCPKRNAEVGGVSNSQHVNGTACDISVPGTTPKEVAAFAETLLPNTGGIGIYSWGVHVDSRSGKSRWNG